MPRKYLRKLSGKNRRNWTEENSRKVLERNKDVEIGIITAARHYEIPSRTLPRRFI